MAPGIECQRPTWRGRTGGPRCARSWLRLRALLWVEKLTTTQHLDELVDVALPSGGSLDNGQAIDERVPVLGRQRLELGLRRRIAGDGLGEVIRHGGGRRPVIGAVPSPVGLRGLDG